MITLFGYGSSALALGVLFFFLIVLGEKNEFRVQRGWYIIIVAFGLLWMGTLFEFFSELFPALRVNTTLLWIDHLVGHGLGMVLLLIGLLLWAPAVSASREKYLLRIKTSEQRYRMLTEKATDMLAEHDLEGRFIFVTPGCEQIVGYEPEDLLGNSIYEYIDPEQLQMVQSEHDKILGNTAPVTVTYRFRHKNGTYIWLESATRIYHETESEGPLRILSISRDVSDRIKYEHELETLNADLELQQTRIRMLYQFAASSNLSVEEQLSQTLAAGSISLGMDLGIISRIRGQEYEVLYFHPDSSGLRQGQIFELGKTYCSLALEGKSTLAIDHMSQSKYRGHPSWEAFHLESYIGIPVSMDGEPFGTLNFGKAEQRPTPFTEADKDFVALMGEWVSRVLEREKAKEEVEQSRERYMAIVNSAVVGVILIDAQGIIQTFNEAAAKIFGYTKDEVIGQNVDMLMPDPEHSQHAGYLRAYLESGKGEILGQSREVHALDKQGKAITIDLGLSEIRTSTEHYFAGTIRDITAHKQAQSDLANAHLQLKNVIDSATQIGIIATDMEGAITVFNPGAERMLGYTAEEVLGKSTDMFHLESERKARAAELSKSLDRKIEGFETYVVLARLGGQVEHEWTYVRKDGSTLQVNSAVTAMYDTDGKATGFLGVVLDITERKQAEEALRLAKVVAEDANQTKSEFLANMSHELRTPLNSVIGFSNILLRNSGKSLSEKDLTYLQRIQANGKHLLNLINDILDLSKIEAGRMELELVELHIDDLIRDLLDQVESQVQAKPVELVAEIPEGLAPSLSDPGKLKQVLLNLLSNAIKFTHEGRVTVRVLADKKSNKVSAIQVVDTGIGIPADRLEKIFDEFSQVDSSTQRKYGGTGLGLSISKAMCELMGCRLEVASEVGKGTTFTIRPDEKGLRKHENGDAIRKDRGKRRENGKPQPAPAILEGKRLLIIDDDPDSRTLLTHYLERTGCILETADSAKQALSALRKRKPDLITLDLQMPRISGEKFLNSLSSVPNAKDVPIVVVSIVARENRGRLERVADYIQKPVQRQQLLWAIRRNLDKRERRILVIEDDPDFRETLLDALSGQRLQLDSAANAEDGLKKLEVSLPDLILLDLKMPGMGGQGFLERLHAHPEHEKIPVIVVTGKSLEPAELVDFRTKKIKVVIKGNEFREELIHEVQEILLQ